MLCHLCSSPALNVNAVAARPLSGVSCEDGEVDECGVCNGFGASCALKVGVALLSASQNGQHGFHQPSRFAFETYMAEALRCD